MSDIDTPQVRKPVHSRSIRYDSYDRGDGLFDVEGVIEDRKHYAHQTLERGELAADEPYHAIKVTLTVDPKLTIVDAKGEMIATPFDQCAAATGVLEGLKGLTLGRGWRKAVDEALARQGSCTHMREMLYSIPSAAIQAIPSYSAHKEGRPWPPQVPAGVNPPHFIGGCVSWRQDSPVVLRHYPQFFMTKA